MNEQDIQQTQAENFRRLRLTPRGKPVFAKELRKWLHQQRIRSVFTFYLISLTFIAFLLYVVIVSSNAISPDPDVRRTLGKIIFPAILLTQLIAVLLVAPLSSADSITSERENKTFDLLQITLLSSGAIIREKLLAGIIFTLSLPLISLPLQSSAYLLGGITPMEYLVSVVLLISTTIFLCAVSVWASTRSIRTSSAMGLTHAITGIIILGLPILAYVIIELAPVSSDQGFFVTLQSISKNLDPILQIPFFIAIWLLIASNPILTATISYDLFQSEGVHVFYELPAFKLQFPLLAPWITFVLLYLGISWLLYRSSIRQMAKHNKL